MAVFSSKAAKYQIEGINLSLAELETFDMGQIHGNMTRHTLGLRFDRLGLEERLGNAKCGQKAEYAVYCKTDQDCTHRRAPINPTTLLRVFFFDVLYFTSSNIKHKILLIHFYILKKNMSTVKKATVQAAFFWRSTIRLWVKSHPTGLDTYRRGLYKKFRRLHPTQRTASALPLHWRKSWRADWWCWKTPA